MLTRDGNVYFEEELVKDMALVDGRMDDTNGTQVERAKQISLIIHIAHGDS